MSDFITTDELAEVWRPLTEAEAKYAALLITAASTWIRAKKPGILDNDPAAKLVTIEVVKAALLPGVNAGFSSVSETVGGKTTAWTLANASAALRFTDHHYLMLGITISAMPVGHFPRDDY